MAAQRYPRLAEQSYARYIQKTRLGFAVFAGTVAFLVLIAAFGLQKFAVAYTLTLFVPLAAMAVWQRSDFREVLAGELAWDKVVAVGVVPIGVFLILVLALIYELHLSYGTPIHRYIAPMLQGIPRSQDWAVLEAPFVEEVIFRLWFQSRLQQWFGITGAVLAGAIFLAFHLSISPWRLGVAAILTWIRYRTGSLGATLIAHYTYDLGLWGFSSFVH